MADHLLPEDVPEEGFTTVTDINSIYDLFNEDKISSRELDRLKDSYYEWRYSPEQRTTILRFYRQPDGTMTIYKKVYVETYGETGNPTNYYRVFIPVESASVSPGSLYWRSAEFKFEGTFIQTTYTEIAPTPRVASMKYIYSLPEKDIPSEVYAENIKNPSDNGRYSGPQLKEEIVQGVAAEGYGFIKRLKSGHSSFRAERTSTDKIIDDLERAWHRIESDMDPRMQSALSILKNIMGLYFEEPCVVVWDNADLVGIVVYRTAHDVDLELQETNITEIASFTHEPGVGGLLVGEVIRIAEEAGSNIIRARHGPGARGFYEKLGFTVDPRHPEIPNLMVYRLKGSNPVQYGTCYEDAWRYLIKEEEGYLIHGSVQLSAEAPRVNHAWVELPTGYIWEPQTKSYYTIEDFKVMSPIEEHTYTVTEAAIMAARASSLGPWTDEQRSEWLGRWV